MTDPSYNRLYDIELLNNKLVNPRLIFRAPTSNRYSHIGGALQIGPDNNLYLAVGDMHGEKHNTTRTLAQNYRDGVFSDGRAGMINFLQMGNLLEAVY